MHSLMLIFHVASIGALFCALTTLLLNLFVMPRLKAMQWDRIEAPLVSVLIPARNEALNIERCLRSLLEQDYPHYQVVVLDDHSSDDTAERVRRLGLNEENGGLLCGAALPSGWVGKNWACHQLSRVASGQYLLFTDADTEHAPGVIGGLVCAAREHQADLVSAWPRQDVVGWSEKLVVSLLPFAGLLFYPHFVIWLLERNPELRGRVPQRFRRALGAANGQVLFFSRDGYDAVGGHEALRSHLVEDVAMGRAMAERMGTGRWWVNLDSGGMVRCRMYRSFWQIWEGFTKNARAAFEDNLGMFLFAGLVQVSLFIGPFVLCLFPGPYRELLAIEVGIVLLMRTIAVLTVGGAWLSVIAHPIAYGLGILIGLNSWRRSLGAGVSWKGRVYPVKHPSKVVSNR